MIISGKEIPDKEIKRIVSKLGEIMNQAKKREKIIFNPISKNVEFGCALDNLMGYIDGVCMIHPELRRLLEFHVEDIFSSEDFQKIKF